MFTKTLPTPSHSQSSFAILGVKPPNLRVSAFHTPNIATRIIWFAIHCSMKVKPENNLRNKTSGYFILGRSSVTTKWRDCAKYFEEFYDFGVEENICKAFISVYKLNPPPPQVSINLKLEESEVCVSMITDGNSEGIDEVFNCTRKLNCERCGGLGRRCWLFWLKQKLVRAVVFNSWCPCYSPGESSVCAMSCPRAKIQP